MELTRMMDRVMEETASRGKAENDKATIEQELAELSSSLFQEANSMVAGERIIRLRAERKMENLEQNLKDTEALMLSQTGQMRDLGGQVEDLEREREDLKKQIEALEEENLAGQSQFSLVPSQVSAAESQSSARLSDAQSLASSLPSNSAMPQTPGAVQRQLAAAISNSHPLQFLSYQVAPYLEFVVFTKSMERIRKNILTRPAYDPNIGYASYGAYGGSANVDRPSQAYIDRLNAQEQKEAIQNATPLSQYLNFGFTKRLAEEDSDPTLRLDQAPGLSFFSKRNISSAIVDGNMVIEPAYTSLPSDKCSLCGTSLERFIASHQSTAPKEDQRRKLTRLATGWIPGSGNSTPMKERDNPLWSISALSDALQGALTPSREASGFNFGSFSPSGQTPAANSGNYTAPLNGSSTSSTVKPKPTSGNTPKDRMQSLPAAANLAKSAEPEMGNFPLIPSARAHAQVYLFRTMDGDTKYALCPTYCLPRLRAVCELWTYVRSIQKGLITEDQPKFYTGGARNDASEYAQQIRKLSSNPLAGSVNGPRGSQTLLSTPNPATYTPSMLASKQLGAPESDSSAIQNEGDDSVQGLGLDISKKDFAYDAKNSTSADSLTSDKSSINSSSADDTATSTTKLASSNTSANTSFDNLSKQIVAPSAASARPPVMPVFRRSSTGTPPIRPAPRRQSTGMPVSPTNRRTSLDIPTQGATPGMPGQGSAAGDFKLTLPPTRPKRNIMRDTTPTSSAVTSPSKANMTDENSPSAIRSTSSAAQSETETPNQSKEASQSIQPSPSPGRETGIISAKSVTPPIPISLPSRAPQSVPPLASPSAIGSMQPPRLPMRPGLSRLASSSTLIGGQANSINRGVSRMPSFEKGNITTSQSDWQAKCWDEIVRLREVVL